MGDVEVSVQRKGQDIILANTLEIGNKLHQVSKTLSPISKEHFTYSETLLKPGDRILLYSDGLTNKSFRAFASKFTTIGDQIKQAIEISRHDNSDNLGVICLGDVQPEGRTVTG